MPITKIIIENFKGIKDRVEIPIRPITLLFGANSAGKSTMLQALLLLRELLEGNSCDFDRLRMAGASFDLGGFREFVHARDEARKVRIGVTVAVDEDGIPSVDPLGRQSDDDLLSRELDSVQRAGVEIELEWSPQQHRPYVTRYEVILDGVQFASVEASPGREAELKTINGAHPLFGPLSVDYGGEEDANDFYSMVDSTIPLPPPANEDDERSRRRLRLGDKVIPDFAVGLPLQWSIPPEVGEEVHATFTFELLNRAMVGVGRLVLDQLRELRYIGPIRRIPERNFYPVKNPGDDRWSDGSGAWDLICGESDDDRWLSPTAIRNLGLGLQIDRLRYIEVPAHSRMGVLLDVLRASGAPVGIEDQFEAEDFAREARGFREHVRLRLIADTTGLELQPSEVGVGVSQVLPVAIGAMAPGYKILAVEQPELHIHPAVQCNLGDLLASQANTNPERVMLLETHSEHLVLRLLRRIREVTENELPPDAPALTPDQVSVLWVEQDEGVVTLKAIPITEEGDFAEQWPRGFFEERANELF